MNQAKRNRLIAELRALPEPQRVPIDVFFDGNDDVGSIGCNLMAHPGIECFRSSFAKIAARADVQAIYVQIAELDPGENNWPFTDTVIVFGTLSPQMLASELAGLKPDEVRHAAEHDKLHSPDLGHTSPGLVAWWD